MMLFKNNVLIIIIIYSNKNIINLQHCVLSCLQGKGLFKYTPQPDTQMFGKKYTYCA